MSREVQYWSLFATNQLVLVVVVFGMCTWSRLLKYFLFSVLGINCLLGLIFYFPDVLILGQGRTLVSRGILHTIGLPLSHGKVSPTSGMCWGKPFTQVSRLFV